MPEQSKIEIAVIENPVEAPKALNIQPPKPETKPLKPETPKHEVFGVSRKSITDNTAAGIETKQGNTVAKAPDQEKLADDDADSIPIPTDEYLVTAMPSLESEIRIPYPSDARARGVAGPVVMDLLIDANGRVREVTLVSGPDPSLNQAAVQAARGFKFRPARVQDKSVAVKIRYTYRFVLEG